MYFSSVLSSVLLALPLALAQTSTLCNPLQKTCPADPGFQVRTNTYDFTTKSMAGWTTTNGAVTYGPNGMRFTINKENDSPTIQTNKFLFFGRVDVVMKAVTGKGIVSSIVLESDDLDEIDWEFLGGFPNEVQTNFFGKGNTTTYDRETTYNVKSASFPTNAQQGFHTYSLIWTRTHITWLIDDRAVRTLKYGDSVAVFGKNFPQTPMNVRLGIWAGGDPDNSQGTIDWAGGLTDYSKAPFTMVVKSVKITNYNPGKTYTYGDKTGSYKSIKIAK